MENIARALINYEGNWQNYEASYAIREAYEDRDVMALTLLNQLGMVAYLQHDHQQAQRLYEQRHECT